MDLYSKLRGKPCEVVSIKVRHDKIKGRVAMYPASPGLVLRPPCPSHEMYLRLVYSAAYRPTPWSTIRYKTPLRARRKECFGW
ncbi:putative transcriptional regulatory protein C3C7.04 [Fusarium oxysporum f. sp. albedinis]|nr:putative transcriptional regulatory protein C3C7.04 [Fusarium oxysporum f. sp. albedinis]